MYKKTILILCLLAFLIMPAVVLPVAGLADSYSSTNTTGYSIPNFITFPDKDWLYNLSSLTLDSISYTGYPADGNGDYPCDLLCGDGSLLGTGHYEWSSTGGIDMSPITYSFVFETNETGNISLCPGSQYSINPKGFTGVYVPVCYWGGSVIPSNSWSSTFGMGGICSGDYTVNYFDSTNTTVNTTVNVTPSHDLVIINLDIKDALTGALIHNSGTGIRNVTSGTWRNSTSPTGLVYFDSTGAAYEYPLSIGENITLAGSGTGYKPDSITFAIPYSNYRAYLNLVPNTVINATGTFTLVVTVVNNKNGLPITGASVTLDTGAMKASNSAGAATFRNVTAGDRQVTVGSPEGQGYSSAVQSVTGTSGETKMITVQLVREGETPVPTYVSPVPTTIPAGNYSSGALNDQGSAGLVQMMGQIISLWPVVFLMGFIYFARKTLGG